MFAMLAGVGKITAERLFNAHRGHGEQKFGRRQGAIFFPGLFFILFSHFCSFIVAWGSGLAVGVLDCWVFGV